jgi:hypothetical protein
VNHQQLRQEHASYPLEIPQVGRAARVPSGMTDIGAHLSRERAEKNPARAGRVDGKLLEGKTAPEGPFASIRW